MVKAGVCETVVAHLAVGKAEVKVFDGGSLKLIVKPSSEPPQWPRLTHLMWWLA